MPRQAYVYLLASQRNGTLYLGVTTSLNRRMAEHKAKSIEGFTKRYNVLRLVYVETYERIVDAIAREKAMKKWNRAWKIKRLQEHNPQWRDLFEEYSQ